MAYTDNEYGNGYAAIMSKIGNKVDTSKHKDLWVKTLGAAISYLECCPSYAIVKDFGGAGNASALEEIQYLKRFKKRHNL